MNPDEGLASKHRRFWIFAGIAVTQIIGWGTTFYPIAIISPAIEADLGLSRELAYSGLTAMLTLSALSAPRIGKLLDRNGPRAIMAIGSVFATLGLITIALAPNLLIYLLGWGLLGIMMPMALALAAFTAITQIMGDGTRRAITVLTFFTGISSTLFWPLINGLQPLLGWRVMLLVFACAHVVICLPIHALLLPNANEHRRRLHQRADNQSTPGVLAPKHHRWGLVFAALTTSAHGVVGWGLALHFIEMFKQLGLSPATAVAIASLNGVMQVSARAADFLFGTRQPPMRVGLISVLLQPLAFIAILGVGATPLTTFLFILGYGVSAGLMTIIRATLPLYLFGRDVYGSYAGRLTLPQNLIFGVAPVAFATVLVRFGPESALWIALLSSCVSVLAMMALARLVALQKSE